MSRALTALAWILGLGWPFIVAALLAVAAYYWLVMQ